MVMALMELDLTPLQKLTMEEYYLYGKKIPQIARERRVHKSTVQRTLRRGLRKLRRYL